MPGDILLLGAACVGKTRIFRQLTENAPRFYRGYRASEGAVPRALVPLDTADSKPSNLWDSAASDIEQLIPERTSDHEPAFLRGTTVVALTYSKEDVKSFNKALALLERARQWRQMHVIVLETTTGKTACEAVTEQDRQRLYSQLDDKSAFYVVSSEADTYDQGSLLAFTQSRLAANGAIEAITEGPGKPPKELMLEKGGLPIEQASVTKQLSRQANVAPRYQKFWHQSDCDQTNIRRLLENYIGTYDTGCFGKINVSFFGHHLWHLKRHHIQAVKTILNTTNENTPVTEYLSQLESIPLANQEGSLARRISYIQEKAATEVTTAPNYN